MGFVGHQQIIQNIWVFPQQTVYGTFQCSIATDHMKWRPLLYRFPSRQPLQAIAPARHSNLKCVSRLRATLYIYIYIYIYMYVCVCVCVYYRTKSEIVSIHDIKVGRESGGTNPLILISALGRGEWSPSRPCSFIPRKEPLYPLNRQARWAAEGVWMVLEKRKFFPPQGTNKLYRPTRSW